MEPNLPKRASMENFRRQGKEVSVDLMDSRSSRCTLDDGGYTSLGDILRTYNAPISEDHAWTLCFLTADYLDTALSSRSSPIIGQILDMELIKLHQEGHVALNLTFEEKGAEHPSGNQRLRRVKISELISKVAVIIYKALDYGMGEDEERSLSLDLETLLDKMVSADEPVEKSFTVHISHEVDINPKYIKDACTRRFKLGGSQLEAWSSPKCFFKHSCQRLVSDTLQLSKFLDVAAQASQDLNFIRFGNTARPLYEKCSSGQQHFKNVAKAWIQVVKELRQGVKLRKLEDAFMRQPEKYEKVPYEMLMEDIKSQRYHLRKVSKVEEMPKSRIPDLHDIILEYIRSRPTLKRVSERVVGPPPPKIPDPFENLMESIRQSSPQRLRPLRRSSNEVNVS